MIAYLYGKVVEKQPTRILIDVGGVGYEVLIPLSSYDHLPAKEEKCKILIHDYVREDIHKLFGFISEAELAMFGNLMATTGIGPKLALSALSSLSVTDLRNAIVEGDVRRLTSISGVGKKMAERMVVELRDKIGDSEITGSFVSLGANHGDESKATDALRALVSLGYKEDAARKMVSESLKKLSGSEVSVEAIIKTSLSG